MAKSPSKAQAAADPSPKKGATGAESPPPEIAAPKIKWRHYVEAGLTFALMAVLGRLSLANASNIGARLARLIAPWSGAWRTANKNLALAMPDLGFLERRRTAGNAFDNFGRTMAEYCKLPSLWRTSWDSVIDVVGREHLQKIVAGRHGAIVFTAHIGNWEIIPMVLAHAGRPAMLVYRALNNPLVDKRIAEIRGLYTASLAPKGADGARSIVEHLQDGGLVYMVVDQKMNTGLEVPFFGVGAMTGKAIARIAMRHNVELIPVRCERLGQAQFRIAVEAPWFVGGNYLNEEDLRSALTRLNQKIEDWVRATPGQWMWMHRRWPKDAKRP
jgi:KDO2-lipid IV(A) lauroyltransferase